jgi:hypothetical protein
MPFNILWAHARYEMITLLRGWFFRIFAGLSLVLFITIDIIFFSTALPIPRMFNGLSSSVPYANMMMLNIGQIVVMIMLATDFFKRDKKTNTTEVFYIRSMTNLTYLLGKLLGILIIIGGLDVVLLGIASIIHLIFSDISFNWLPYFLYPLVMAMPAFIFIVGVAYLLMSLLKNQAIVVLLLLGYFAAELFYLHDKHFFIYDFLAMNLPLAYSDFVGFSNFDLILWQRGIYICLGLAFIFLTGLIFIRLPQSVLIRKISIVSIVSMFMLAALCTYLFQDYHTTMMDNRTKMRQLNKRYSTERSVVPYEYEIDLEHNGDKLSAIAAIKFRNQSDESLGQIFFSINPDLEVQQIEQGNTTIPFKQNRHIVNIDLPEMLEPTARDSIRIVYKGSINTDVCFLDIDDNQFWNSYFVWLYQIQKKYAFLSSDFVLLSPECLWYPQPGLSPGGNITGEDITHFSSYSLDVSTAGHLTAISQGRSESDQQGHFTFRTEQPLPQISLVIGMYKTESVQVDSVQYSLYHHVNHNYFEEYFTVISDTLGALIQELQQEYAVRLNLDYPYERMSLIEVPIQYYSHPRIWTVVQETVQPEQVWMPENGFFLASTDFKRLKRSIDRRVERSNQTLSEQETQVTVFKNFIRYTFHGQIPRFMRGGGPQMEYKPDFNIFPNYYSYVNTFQTASQPILNAAVEAYLYETPISFVRAEGLTNPEKVSRLLNEKSLAKLIKQDKKDALLSEVIKTKGAYLLKMMQSTLGTTDLDEKMSGIIQNNRFKKISFVEFIEEIYGQGDIKLAEFLDLWFHDTRLPGYLISNIQMFKILDDDRVRYQILFKARNTETIPGLFEVTFQYGGAGRQVMTGDAESEDPGRVILMNSAESKEIGIILDAEPRSINLDFIIARNIPLIFSEQFDKAEMNDRFVPFAGERPIDDLAMVQNDEIIIDNEDESFSAVNPPYQSVLKRWLYSSETEEADFDRYRWWNPPQRWRALKNTTFYGRYIHSAYYIRSGTGSKQAVWQASLPQNGLYDIFTYMFRKEDLWRSRRRGSQINYGDYNYVVYHDAGRDEVILDADRARQGWNYLGTYFFSQDSAKVALTDKSNGRVIIADAIKWVKN